MPEPKNIYEDANVLVISKPSGVITDDACPPNWRAAHRLDKDTSGVLLIAKTEQAKQFIQKQFQERETKKEYLALVYGVPKETSGTINQPLKRSSRFPMRRTVHDQGKDAITEWTIEDTFEDKYALLRLKPKTGRTHQLRAHLHWLGYPIVGDPLYYFKSIKKSLPFIASTEGGATNGQMLHAEKLSLKLPSGEEKTFSAPLPEDFHELLQSLK